MNKPEITKKPAFTGRAVTIQFTNNVLCQLVILDIVNGVVAKEDVVTNPDMTNITAFRGEQAIWDIISQLRGTN